VRPNSALAGQRVLVIDSDLAHATTTVEILRAHGADADWVADVTAGLRALASREPAVLLLALALASPAVPGAPPQGDGGLWLLRRLRDDYMGRRPHVIVTERADRVDARLADFGVDAVMLKPASAETLLAAVLRAADPEDATHGQGWYRELIKASVLEGDTQFALTSLAKRLQLAARVHDCIITATVSERDYAASAGGTAHEEFDSPVWESARVSLDAGATVLAQDPSTTSSLAVPIEQPGGTRLGVMVLHDDRARTWAPDVREALVALGQRIYSELAWRSVQERITADNARLYEISMLDPMLPGVWTRAALDQALAAEVAARQRSGDPVTVAILDLRRLRAINDRHGHAAGDAAMKHVAHLVRQQLRPHDLLARYAGDALAVVLVRAALADARRVVERLREAVAHTPLEWEGRGLGLEIVGGLACSLTDDDTAEVTLARASLAAKAAKRKSDGIVVADAQLSELDAPDSQRGLEAGAILGGMYKIIHEIDRGAMGVVYRAEDMGLGRAVALKTLRPDLARDLSFVARFRGEATTLAALRHENLVQVHSFGSDGDDVYFVMELVEGEPLEERLTRAEQDGPAIPLPEVMVVLEQIAGALDTMHHAGILHRDVKPANIVLDRAKNRAVLVDVGIAKRRGGPTDAAGTPGFIAPESFQGGAEGPTADVYGLAATAYMVLAMVPPFGDGDITQILRRQEAKASLPPSAHRPGLPHAVDKVLLQSLDPDASKRHPSAGALVTALGEALTSAAPDVQRGDDFKPRRKPVAGAAPETTQLRGAAAVTREQSPSVVAAVEALGPPPVPGPALDAHGAGRPSGSAGNAAADAGRPPTAVKEQEVHKGRPVEPRAVVAPPALDRPDFSADSGIVNLALPDPHATDPSRPAARAGRMPEPTPYPERGARLPEPTPYPERGARLPEPTPQPFMVTPSSSSSSGSFPGLGTPLPTLPPSNQAMRAALRQTPGRPSRRVATLPPGMGLEAPAQTRGVLFRAAPGLLGARRGAAWLRELSRQSTSLAEVLQPQGSLLAWYPTDLYLLMLHSVPADSREPRAFARELGRSAAAATFARFLGADPNKLNAQTLLDMIGVLWHRYHTWGRLEVAARAPGMARLHLGEGLRDPLLTASVAGILEKVAGLSGLHGAALEVAADDAEGAAESQFVLRWREPG